MLACVHFWSKVSDDLTTFVLRMQQRELEFSRSLHGPTGGFPNEGDISTLVPTGVGETASHPCNTTVGPGSVSS